MTQWRGHCFEYTMKALVAGEFPPGSLLVHGVPLGRGPIEGTRFAHAWIEVPRDVGMWLVIDLTTKPGVKDAICLPREVYYLMGDIKSEDCKYYTAEEAIHSLLEHAHFGPWELDESKYGA